MKLDNYKQIADEYSKDISDTHEMRMNIVKMCNEGSKNNHKLIRTNGNLKFVAVVVAVAILTTTLTIFIKNNRNISSTLVINTLNPAEITLEPAATSKPDMTPAPTKEIIKPTPTEEIFVEDPMEYDPTLIPMEPFNVNDIIPEDSKYQPFYGSIIDKKDMKEGITYYSVDSVEVLLKIDRTNFYDPNILKTNNFKSTLEMNFGRNKFIAIEIFDKSKNGVINAIKTLQKDKNVYCVRLEIVGPKPVNN